MSIRYLAVNWNRQKRIYDSMIALGVGGAIAGFAVATGLLHPDATIETTLIRALGLTGLVLLHLILAIGPAARIDRRFLPLLYNRRHLGVTLGALSLAHATFVVIQYHAFGNLDPVASVLWSNPDWTSLAGFPFEWFGAIALVILFVMAATSHDYWLSVLSPPTWKRLHMLVYVAYLALLLHVGLGVLQDERHPLYVAGLGVAALAIGLLHLVAALKERRADRLRDPGAHWVDLCAVAEVPEGRARIGVAGGERVAVFRHQGRLSAVSNVCKHQNGPLGEGRIVDGCITCPWHGYQFRPDTGTSPPPFTDSVPTYDLRVSGGRVLVASTPNPPGTRVEPVPAESPAPSLPDGEFYLGYGTAAPPGLARFGRRVTAAILIGTVAVAVAAAAGQRTFAPARFDYGRPSTLEGRLRTQPYPLVEVARPGDRSVSRYLLSVAGKHGAQAAVRGLEGRRVRVTGPLAYRGAITLLEIASLTALPDSTAAEVEPLVDLGVFRLEGEIVDGKCYAGVMNPGAGKAHRGCAARCLAGGIAPLFATRDSTGASLDLVVVGSDMAPIAAIGRAAGKPLVLTGRVKRQGDLWFLAVAGGRVDGAD